MQVKELIRTPVTTCSTKTNVGEARDIMVVKKFSALPVVEIHENEVTLKGIVSYHDLVGVYNDEINVQQVMTANATVVSSDTDVRDAAKIMIEKKIHHLVVVDDGEVKGIISSFDYVRIVANSGV